MSKNPSTILIADDERAMREALGELLIEKGYNVAFAKNGAETMTKARESAPDLILLDVMMPDIDGFTVCQNLRADEFLAQVPIIMITALGDRASRLRGFEAGADDYVSKPIEQPELLARVKTTTHLNRYRKLIKEQNSHKMAEEALQISETRYRQLFDRVPVGLYRSTLDGETLEANQALTEMLGYPDVETFLATNATEAYVDPKACQRWQAMIEQEEIVLGFEAQWRRHDGTTIWVQENARLVRDEEGQPLYYEGSVEDITEHRQAEEALEHSLHKAAHGQVLLLALSDAARAVQRARTPKEVYQTIGEEIAQLGYRAAIFDLTEDGKYLTAGYMTFESDIVKAAEKLIGLSAQDYRVRLTPGGFYERLISEGEPVFSASGSAPLTEILPKAAHPLADKLADLLGMHQAIYVPLKIGGQTRALLAVMGADLTEDNMSAMTAFTGQAAIAIENARLYQTAQQERDRAQQYLDIAGAMLVAIDAKGEITLINRKGCDIIGFEEGRLLGKNWFDTCLPSKVRKTVKSVFNQLIAGEIESIEYYENPVLTKSGEERLIAWRNTMLRDQAGNIVGTLSSGEDITDRKRTEEALRESEERHRTLFETMTQGVLYWDAKGRVVSANPATERILGLTLDQLQGKAPTDPHWKLIRQSGAEILEEALPAMAALRSGEEMHDAIFRFFNPVLDSYRWVKVNAMPLLRPGEDTPYRAYTTLEDITERVQAEAEIKQRNEELVALNEIGQAIVSTLDLRETLTTIAAYTTQLMNMAATSVVLLDEINDDLYFAAASGEGSDFIVGQRLSKGQGVAGWVIEHGEPVLIPDVSQDDRWYSSFDAEGGFTTHSILCVPLKSKGRVIGALEAINKEYGFGQDDLHLLNALVAPISTAIENARLFEQVRVGREQLQMLSRRLVEMQETERAHVARELHDETGQALSSMLLNLGLLEQEADQPETVITRTNEMIVMVDDMLENLHRLAMNLRPATLDHLGLVPALEQYIETFNQQYSIKTQFEAVGLGEVRLPPEVETALYRIVQESLTNVVRHAQATHADVLVERRDDQVLTIIEDNGTGFDSKAAMQTSRLGLLGMRERAEMLNGKLVIESAPGSGTTVLVEVPYTTT
jgi:PAS domain S-box-containing protein